MGNLLLYSLAQYAMTMISYLVFGAVVFLLGVYFKRYVYGFEKMVDALQKQNEYSMVQIRLLKKMLINAGVASNEIDDIIRNGNN
jgi:hypothetical protein